MSQRSRQQAIHRIRVRRHLAMYVVFHLALSAYFIALWARSGADHFWPVWPMLGGAIGLMAQASHLFDWHLPISEHRIQRELDSTN